MNELPEHARKLIAHERTAAGPSQATRERVRRSVMLALAAGVGASAAHASASAASGSAAASKPRWLATTSGKLWLGAGLVAVIGAGSLALRVIEPQPSAARGQPAPAAEAMQVSPATPAPQPLAAVTVDSAPATHEPAQAASPVREPAPQPAARRKPSGASSSERGDLRAEMLVLAEASSALERGELEAARAQLALYRARFGRGQLKEEERGLDALARCLAREPGAKLNARRYLQRAQAKLLAQRIEAACKETP